MIQKLEINGVHMTVGEELRKYVGKKIGHMDTYISKHARDSVHIEVKLKEGRAKDNQIRTCEVIVHLPHEVIALSETTVNIYAAIDIVEAKLKQRLRKYKDLHATPKFHRRMLARLKRQAA
jgi:ribosomal subunit interface protein